MLFIPFSLGQAKNGQQHRDATFSSLKYMQPSEEAGGYYFSELISKISSQTLQVAKYIPGSQWQSWCSAPRNPGYISELLKAESVMHSLLNPQHP